jgi:hypothetical protein
VVPDGRDDQICAVNGDHASLDESRPWVVFLNDGVDAHNRDDEA